MSKTCPLARDWSHVRTSRGIQAGECVTASPSRVRVLVFTQETDTICMAVIGHSTGESQEDMPDVQILTDRWLTPFKQSGEECAGFGIVGSLARPW